MFLKNVATYLKMLNHAEECSFGFIKCLLSLRKCKHAFGKNITMYSKKMKQFNLKMYIMYMEVSKVYQKIFYVCVKNVHWIRRKNRQE